jgi:hypothetical protein
MTFLAPSGPSGDHLFVVVLGPVQSADYGSHGQYLLVNFSSINPSLHHDPACISQPGEHPFITSPSYAYYRKAIQKSEQEIQKLLSSGVFKRKEDCSPSLLKKLSSGASNTREMKNHLKQLFGIS